jgi:type IV secretory pathway TrbL component
MRKLALVLLWALLLLALAAFTLFAFNGLVIPIWHSLTTQESAFQSQHGGYFVGALVMMVLSALAIWTCLRWIKRLS